MMNPQSLVLIKNEAKTQEGRMLQVVQAAYIDGYLDAGAKLTHHITKMFKEKNPDASTVYKGTEEVKKVWNKRYDELVNELNDIKDEKNSGKKKSSKEDDIYLLFTCDQWESRASMNLVGISSDIKKIKGYIKKLIKSKKVELSGSDKFQDDWDIREINSNIDYLFLQQVSNNSFEDGSYL